MKLKTFLPVLLFATLALPITAQAQGTVRGAQEGAAVGDRDAAQLGRSSAGRLVRSPARSAGFSASTIVRVSTNTLRNSGTPHTAIAMNCA